MIVLGLALLVLAALIKQANPDGGLVGMLLFGLFGAGLIVGGLVIRP